MNGCIDPALLSDYWLAALPPGEEERVEEHLLGCDRCARELERLAALGEAIRKVVRQGRVRLVISREFLERLEAEGLRVRTYSPPPGAGVQCTITAGDDLLVARLSAELAGARRIDILQCDASGIELRRVEDVPFDARSGEIIVSEQIDWVRTLPSHRMRMKLVSVEPGKPERLLAEYTFDHTASA
jgi:hypothetical protein